MHSFTNTLAIALKTDSVDKITSAKTDNVPTKIKLSFQAIVDPSIILGLKEEIDDFVNKWSKNPFLLSGFIIQSMKSNRVKGWTPIVLIIKTDGKIVGMAPLIMKKRLGIRFANFLLLDSWSPDLVFDNRYQEACMGAILEYLFKNLNCRFVSFNLPFESSNLKTIEQQCKPRGIGFSTETYDAQSIIPVESSWDEFLKKKSRRRIIRQIERKMDEIGSWRIECIEKVSNRPDVLKKLLDVESMSWKAGEPWVFNLTKEELLMTWEGLQIMTGSKTDLKGSVWFLEINCETVAYTYAIKYKGTAFILKISYDERYKKSYVGKYINNIAIRDMFNEGQIKTINFMSEFPFMTFWTSSSLKHAGVSMWNFGKLVKSLQSNTAMLRILRTVVVNLPSEQKRLLDTLYPTQK
jgi:hypothetical protein